MNSTNTSQTAYLLALMKKGDDAFNSRDVAAMNATHHPDLIAHVTGSAKPIFGRTAHAAMIQQMLRIFPDVHVHNDPYPIQFGNGDWITVITRTTGTFTGEMKLPDGKVIAPTGKAFDLNCKRSRSASLSGKRKDHRARRSDVSAQSSSRRLCRI
jgi:hypothetical protein